MLEPIILTGLFVCGFVVGVGISVVGYGLWVSLQTMRLQRSSSR